MADQELAALLARKGIHDRRVLHAIAHLSRTDFVRPADRPAAGNDAPLSIGFGQTISQPFVVAFMSQALELAGHERVLEIGTGSGYQTAVLALLCREVHTVEILQPLARAARRKLRGQGFENIYFREGDGGRGWPEAAPFDRILATAAPAAVPPALLEQLGPGGRLVVPVGPGEGEQELFRYTRGRRGGALTVERLLPVRFVPMTGLAGSL